MMGNLAKRIGALVAGVVVLTMTLAVPGGAAAQALETPARQAYLIDLSTDTVLFAKNADDAMTPSSMSKLMTVYLVFERLAKGSLKLTDTFPVSERAWRMQGSKMFVMVGTQVSVADLLRGIIVQSGNDACIVVAEGLASSEEAFAAQMTAKARELGLTGSRFANASGWPDPNQVMTAHDLAILADRLITDFPQYYPIFSEKDFTYGGITQGNRDPLLGKVPGADGLKTGHTDDGGFGLVGSVQRDGRRLVLVLNGLSSMAERAAEGARIMEWGFREFEAFPVAKAGDVLADAPVWLGAADTVGLTVAKDTRVSLRRAARPDMTVKVVYDSPIPAPVAAGDHVADLVISVPDSPDISLPLVAAAEVGKAGLFGRIFGNLRLLLTGEAG